MNDDSPATKRDLDLAISRLERFVIDRESALTWKIITLQITYFFGTLATMWFMLAHYKP